MQGNVVKACITPTCPYLAPLLKMDNLRSLCKHLSDEGLQNERGDRQRIPPELASKAERVLAGLDVPAQPSDMDLPDYRLHRLRGEMAGLCSMRVSGNWRIVFRFEGVNVRDVDLVDYH